MNNKRALHFTLTLTLFICCFQPLPACQTQVSFELGLNKAPPVPFTPKYWAAGVMVPRPYADQTDTTAPGGRPSNNDLALVWLNSPDFFGTHVGDVGGWYSYGTNGYGFSRPVASYGFPAAPASAMVTGFSYSGGFDNRWLPQISHSEAYNMVIATNQSTVTGGKPLPPGFPGAPQQSPLKNIIK